MQTTFARSLRWPYRGFSEHPTTNSQNPKTTVAIFHLSVKAISRSAGRSSTAAAAYRAGVEITDERTGEIHDYRRKAGIESAELFLPDGAPEWATDRAKLWNAAEQSEKRKNSTVAREFEVALPSELSADQRRELAHDFARELVKRHGFAVDVAIHAPGKEGDTRNHHAHILCTTRRLTAEGFTEKTRELDDRAEGAAEVTHWREQWAGLTNAALERAGQAVRVDHRSLEVQGIDREPAIHLGRRQRARLPPWSPSPRRRPRQHQKSRRKKMTEFEGQLLQHLQKQADQLTALSLSQSRTTAALLEMSKQQAAILAELSKEPSGESLKDTMAGLLKPLEANLSALVGSFNKLLTVSEALSAQLPSPPTR
jgi:ATP-dependent exoDNAse (exonuclease V) alpha subunit